MTDAISEIAVERIASGRFRDASFLFAASVALTYYAHRHVRPEPRTETARCVAN